jgi:exodeoxyribonuclease VII small subunit
MAKDSFEGHLAKLEEIAEKLEAGDMGLDEALKTYEQGLKAYRAAAAFLKKAEKKVKVLVDSASGEVTEEPFDDRASVSE